ncbi:MAG: sodium-translocating pyrophosphatase [Deltaproteobacteria bacterium RIFCSPLOWO2_12_FULL_57_22]|nr:MAG: sodium-translocating pyrophosphatase [Deltaproteobacteria bacterium RIFCSPLOWO2_12_FULL_57_22]
MMVSGIVGVLGLLFVVYLSARVLAKEAGNATMQELSGYIYEGAMAFLFREYRAIGIFAVAVAFLLVVGIGWETAAAYLIGAICSLGAGLVGMHIATRANVRTAQAATRGFNEAISVAFPGGAVMGMTVVSVGLLALSVLYWVFGGSAAPGESLLRAVNILAGVSMGASSVALFARVGGGIYTKAADVGADLVGKVEAGIPEDDPRNPAVIADLVGDNVGDVAGMGADLFESYVGAIVSGMIIAAATLPPEKQLQGVSLALLLAAVGVIASILGTFFVRTAKGDPQTALRNGTVASAVLSVVGAFLVTWRWYGDILPFWAFLSGVIAGMVIGFVAEYYTSGKRVQMLADFCRTGTATNIIQGIGLSYRSTVLPLVLIALATILSFQSAGFFGLALSAIGMLSIAGITVAVDAYGPISDNAGGIAEMAHMGREVRQITDSLDAAGNTTAAIAKGFAIGSAALTALALFASYTQVAGIEKIDIMNPNVVAGLFIGGIVPFLFAGDAMLAVGKAAFGVVEEVRRQFKEIPGLMEGKARAEYARCVDITTAGALRQMVAPGVLAVTIPIVVGIALGVETLGGMLAGALVSGVPLALHLANAGGAWDNAKKYIEAGNLGGKGSEAHKAAVVGDTVGDPCKDTAAPAMNILLKLMAVVSLVFAPLIIAGHRFVLQSLGF